MEPPAPGSPGAGEPSTAAQTASAPPLQGDAGSADGTPSWAPGSQGSDVSAVINERPEIAVGAAFAGGLVFALILKRLAR
ncbi:MAG TPA: hypothetical protein VGG87_02955 [Solirubrobacteraceae bacterium]